MPEIATQAHIPRRALLAWALGSTAALLASGCGTKPPAAARPPTARPIEISRLSDIMALAGLRWLIVCRPREIATIPWLVPAISTLAPEHRLAQFAESTGMDLRQIREASIGAYRGDSGESTFYLARYSGDAQVVERAFRRRLTGRVRRSVSDSGIVHIAGSIGTTTHALVIIGPDIAGFQQGGSPSRGLARIAALYAEAKLKRSPTVLAEEPLRSLDARFGDAPFRALALGPFTGEYARAIHGLLAGATAAGFAARPSARQGVLIAIAVAGDFSTSADAASEALWLEWNRIAGTRFGHLLGLDQPASSPLRTHGRGAIALSVELDPSKLAAGIAAATVSQVEEIMR